MKISLSSVPNQHATKMVDFPRLDGGLNLWEMDYRLNRNQSPEMKNLWWQDGVLQCRDGQSYLYGPSQAQLTTPLPEGVEPWVDLGTGYTCTSDLFWDHAFFHIGTKLYYMDPSAETPAMTELIDGVPENRGTFFRYNDGLFYKNRGAFIKVKYDPAETPMFSATHVEDDAYTPIIVMNASPSTGSGDTYQPENRLSPKKTVQYNAAEDQQMIKKRKERLQNATLSSNTAITSAIEKLNETAKPSTVSANLSGEAWTRATASQTAVPKDKQKNFTESQLKTYQAQMDQATGRPLSTGGCITVTEVTTSRKQST